ncbi:FliM/FliN family flagellar motor switch protein [Rhizosaccharibacter radicis]|uniref:FliM/FliN family flagellar motor switch protein n=1 Tax=Rhizosaccharibacter radicis TaxID=2782605 RepID=A0ABT1VTF1_9PROT|nr:FliM/FliN family flagellar motor switch protein [Acetobacteraceae bacterium KSS12]
MSIAHPDAVVRPIEPLRLSAADAEALNRAHRWHAPLPLPGNETFSLHLFERPGVPSDPPGDWLRLRFSVGDDPFEAELPQALMLDLMRSLDGELLLEPPPAPDVAALLLEGALLPLVDAAERGLGRAVRLDTLEVPSQPLKPEGRTVLLNGGGLNQLLLLCGAPDAVRRLLSGWPPGRRPMSKLPVSAAIELGSTVLTRRLLRSLRVGDAVLLQHDVCAPAADGGASVALLRVADRLGAVVRRAGSGWRLETPPRILGTTEHGVSENGSSASGSGAAPGIGPAPGGAPPAGATPDGGRPSAPTLDGAALDELPVRLRFEAGRAELPLGTLRGLGAGSVLLIEGEAGRAAILVGDRRIGTGTLVSVDGRPGIRIDSFADWIDGGASAENEAGTAGA